MSLRFYVKPIFAKLTVWKNQKFTAHSVEKYYKTRSGFLLKNQNFSVKSTLLLKSSVRPKEEKLVSAETEYSATLAETFGRIFGRNQRVEINNFFYLFFTNEYYHNVEFFLHCFGQYFKSKLMMQNCFTLESNFRKIH